MNPSVCYRSSGKRLFGLAINLKGLLDLSDKSGILCPSEIAVRSSLDKKCLGSAKQYFLQDALIGKRTSLGGRQDQICKAAICIPKSAVSEECMNYLQSGW